MTNIIEKMNLKTISTKLTLEILEKSIKNICIKKYGSDNDKIVDYTVNYASNKGDSYIGVIYRIKIILSNNETLNIIAKGMPKNISRRELFHCADFFNTEYLFYNKIVPKFNEFIRKQQRNNDNKNSLLNIPECFYSYCDGTNDFLLLEDLFDDGYKMIEKNAGLNLSKITIMLKMFAKFHGISLAIKFISPEIFKEITKDIIEPLYSKKLERWYANNAIKISQIFYNSIKNEIKNTKYLEKLLKFINPNILYKTLIKNVELKEPSVICHGDIWLTNFMFNQFNCKAIDFQMLRHGSPMLDISTFIFCCIDEKQRLDYGGVKTILNVYQKELNKTVISLGAPEIAGISENQIYKLWYEIGAHGFGAALALVPISVIDCDEVGDLDMVDEMCEHGLELENVITQFKEIKSEYGKQRLIETVVLAVDEGII